MSLKILVVDDEPEILSLIKALAEPLGCEVLTSSDSLAAAKLIASRKFDGVFVDARMPHLDGFQLVQQIRSSRSNKKVPIVMLSGYDDIQTRRQAFSAGITLFLGKPITQEHFTHMVNALRGAFLREKRRYTRLTLLAPVVCRWQSDGPQSSKISSLDISEQGMALIRIGTVNLGQALDLEFQLPEIPEPIRVRASVVRKMPPDGVGVTFIDLSPDDRQRIQRYIMGTVRG